MDNECTNCGRTMLLREGCDPTPFCDECAHGEVERLSQMVILLGEALEYQESISGIHGVKHRHTLKSYRASEPVSQKASE